MGTNLHVRNLDEDIVRRLKQRAVANNRSMEAEHRAILAEALKPEPELSFQQLALQLQAKTADRKHTPSEEILRISRAEAR